MFLPLFYVKKEANTCAMNHYVPDWNLEDDSTSFGGLPATNQKKTIWSGSAPFPSISSTIIYVNIIGENHNSFL